MMDRGEGTGVVERLDCSCLPELTRRLLCLFCPGHITECRRHKQSFKVQEGVGHGEGILVL